MTDLHRHILISLTLLLAGLAAGRAAAEASLFVYPTFVMFEGNRASAEVTIANRGDEIGTFEIGWSNMSMTEEGGLIRHEEEVAWSVQPFLRYSPRRVTLTPGQSQVIKIALRRDDTIPEAEYYSHLRVVTINSASPDAGDGDVPQPVPGVSVTARTAIAIPVVWRNSRAAPEASIDAASFDRSTNEIAVIVTRHGLLSARGFLHVISPSQALEARTLADPMPLILYPNIDRRSVKIMLREGLSASQLPDDAAVVYSPDETLTESSVNYAVRPVAQD